MTKRLNGEGHIRQRNDGRWETQLTVDGKRVSIYGKTAEDVAAKRDDARGRIKREEPVVDSTQRLRDYIEHWCSTALEASDRAESTKVLYSGLAKRHIVPALGDKPLAKLRKTDVDGLLVKLKKAGLSESTRRQIYVVLRAVLDDAKLDELLASNAAAKVKRPTVTAQEARYLTVDEVTSLLAAAEGLRYAIVLKLLAVTGARKGEALAWRWSDLSVDDKTGGGVLKISRTLGRLGGELKFGLTKSKRSREVPVSAAVVTMLKTHKAAQAAERLAAGDRWLDHGLIFATEHGTPVEPRNILRSIEIAAKRAKWVDDEGAEHVGLDDTVVHTLRHSAATAWLEGGLHLKAVSTLLGHHSISVTADIYGHVSEPVTRAAIDGLTERLGL
jgi:integrase